MSTNLPRVHQKIFGLTASETDPKRIAQFGSVVAGDPNLTGDIEEIQALNNWEQGWVGSTVTERRYPTAEETTGINKVLSQQLAYLFQKGIPEWCPDVTYFANTGFCQKNGVIYQSLADQNINNDPEDDLINWKVWSAGGNGSGYEINDLVWRLTPTEDASKHLLDGALLLYGTYKGYIDKIAELYEAHPTASCFAQPSDALWTQPVLSSNGTMGGDSFAVSSNVEQLTGNDVWRAFNGTTSGGNYFHSQTGTKTGYIDMYSPVSIKITNFKIYNQDGSPNRASSAGVIYGSNDGSDWTQLATYTNSVQTAGGTWDISLSSNEHYYKYYRMESTAGGSDSYWTINEVEITAFYQQSAEATWQASVAQYGSCGKFVYDSVNNTVRLPKVSDILQCTTDLNAVGDLIEAGLPNVTGTFILHGAQGASDWSGAFYQDGTGGDWSYGHDRGSTNPKVAFDASRSSSLYKNNFTKVQPQTIKGLLYIVIATSTKTDIQVDIDEIATDLNGKADVDLTNTSDTGKVLMSSMSAPSDTYINFTVNASGSTYTAPADGYFTARVYMTSGSGFVYLSNNNNGICSAYTPGTAGNGDYPACFIRVKEGDIIELAYSNIVTWHWFRFVYSKGSESEAN